MVEPVTEVRLFLSLFFGNFGGGSSFILKKKEIKGATW